MTAVMDVLSLPAPPWSNDYGMESYEYTPPHAPHSPHPSPSVCSSFARSLQKMVLLELTDFLWFLSGLLQMSPGAFFEKLNRGVDRFGGALFGIPNWGSRR